MKNRVDDHKECSCGTELRVREIGQCEVTILGHRHQYCDRAYARGLKKFMEDVTPPLKRAALEAEIRRVEKW